MSDSGNRIRERGYFARRIWHGPNETCWHVWLEAAGTGDGWADEVREKLERDR